MSEILGILLGCSIVLIPVIGLTARFALKPLVEAIARARGAGELQRLEARIAALEHRLELASPHPRPALVDEGIDRAPPA